jgi:hypothetical protein
MVLTLHVSCNCMYSQYGTIYKFRESRWYVWFCSAHPCAVTMTNNSVTDFENLGRTFSDTTGSGVQSRWERKKQRVDGDRNPLSSSNGSDRFIPNRSHMNMDISRHNLSESDMEIEKVDKEMDTYKAALSSALLGEGNSRRRFCLRTGLPGTIFAYGSILQWQKSRSLRDMRPVSCIWHLVLMEELLSLPLPTKRYASGKYLLHLERARVPEIEPALSHQSCHSAPTFFAPCKFSSSVDMCHECKKNVGEPCERIVVYCSRPHRLIFCNYYSLVIALICLHSNTGKESQLRSKNSGGWSVWFVMHS